MLWLIALQAGFNVWMAILWLRQHWRDTEFELQTVIRLDRLERKIAPPLASVEGTDQRRRQAATNSPSSK